jgi:hypothetical protein
MVVRKSLRVLKEHDEAREQLHVDVQAGFDQLARSEGRAYDKTASRQLAEQIKSRGRAVLPGLEGWPMHSIASTSPEPVSPP